MTGFLKCNIARGSHGEVSLKGIPNTQQQESGIFTSIYIRSRLNIDPKREFKESFFMANLETKHIISTDPYYLKTLDAIKYNNNEITFFIDGEDISSGKNFITNDESEFQVASFLLDEQEIIEKHIHPNQERKILNTSEVLILLEGEIEVTIYDKDLNFVTSRTIVSGDTVALMSGGHGLEIKEKSKFIEVKQGPYDEETDKVRF